MKILLIATKNAGKFLEIEPYLKDCGFELKTLRDFSCFPPHYEVDEPAETFEGNALIKAFTIGRRADCLTLAEDAGLEVDALQGRPGVRTARYAPGTDEDRYRHLLAEMRDVPPERRNARFRAVMAIYDPATEKVRTCAGTYEGLIATEPSGTNGFGYDPVFFSVELQKTSAMMTAGEKHAVSHRGHALRRAKDILINEFL